MQETRESWVRSLDWEDPLEKEMTSCSSILAWRIQWTEEPGGLQSMGSQRVRHYAMSHASLLLLHLAPPPSPSFLPLEEEVLAGVGGFCD